MLPGNGFDFRPELSLGAIRQVTERSEVACES